MPPVAFMVMLPVLLHSAAVLVEFTLICDHNAGRFQKTARVISQYFMFPDVKIRNDILPGHVFSMYVD